MISLFLPVFLFIDYIVGFFESIFNLILSLPELLYDLVAYLLGGLRDLLVSLLVEVATFVLERLPDAQIDVPGAPELGSWFWDLISVLNIVFDMGAVGLTITVMVTTEIIFLIIHLVLWIKRFIPTMGH